MGREFCGGTEPEESDGMFVNYTARGVQAKFPFSLPVV